jgi:hemolysin III
MYKGEWVNSISHLVGTALALAGLVILVVLAGVRGDAWKIASFSIYGVSLVLLYLLSTLYHSFRGAAKRFFQKLDHAAIYLLIAGTYTPFTLVTLRGAWGWTLFGVIWGLALFGLLQDVLLRKRSRLFSVMLYVIMGWLALAAIRPLAAVLPRAALFWLISGGISYTIGVIFYVSGSRFKYGHPIFHFFVLGGSICHYITIFFYIA